MKRLFRLLVVSILMLFMFGCGKNNKLTVGTNCEFEPFDYLEGQEIVGFDIDLMKEVSKIIGREIEFKNMAFDGLLPAMQAGKIDLIIAGMTATEDRRKSVNFTNSYYISEQNIIVNEDNNEIKDFNDFTNKNIGVVLGYTGDVAVSKLDKVNVTRFSGTADAVIALKAKKVDAIVIDSEPAKKYAEKNPELKLIITDVAKEEYAIAVAKSNTKLVEEINNALEQIKSNGKYEELLVKYNLKKD